MNLSKAVKVIMIEKGLRAIDVARELGVSRQALHSTIGEGSNPAVGNKTLHGVCKALNIKLSELIARAEEY